MPPIRLLAALPLLCLATAGVPAAAAEPPKTTVYRAGHDGYHTFRIPVLLRAANGDLLAFAEGRKNGPGDAGDIDLVMKRSADGGASWGRPQLVQDEWDSPDAGVTLGNPTPVVDAADPEHPGRVWLLFTRDNDRVFSCFSDDHGATWSDRVDITADVKDPDWNWYATGPVHGLQLTSGPHAGRLVIPCDHRSRSTKGWGAHLVYSDDHGRSWRIGARDTTEPDSAVHPNECVALQLPDGRVYVNARDQHGADPATRAVAVSEDGGRSFTAGFRPEPALASPVVQNSAIALHDRDVPLIVYSGPSHPAKRRDMTLRLSRDNAATWAERCVVGAGPAAYSDLARLADDRVGLLYEAGDKLYDQIVFCSFALDELDWQPTPQ